MNLCQVLKSIITTKSAIKRSKQNTFCYCPQCRNELVGSNSFASDKELVVYKCTNCGHESKWLFDAPVPILIDR
jgi:transposase-like protein